MKIKYWVCICLFVTGINSALAVPAGMKEPYIDDIARKYDEMRLQAYDVANTVCKKRYPNNLSKKMSCTDEELKNYPVRSTPEWNKKMYKNLTNENADKVLISLSQKLSDVRNVSNFRRKIGEITRENLQHQGEWIQENIFKREPYKLGQHIFEPFRLSTGEVILPFYNVE